MVSLCMSTYLDVSKHCWQIMCGCPQVEMVKYILFHGIQIRIVHKYIITANTEYEKNVLGQTLLLP